MQKGSIKTNPENSKQWLVRWNDEKRLPDGSIKPWKPSKTLPKVLYPKKEDAQRWLNEKHLNTINKANHQPVRDNEKFGALFKEWKETVFVNYEQQTQDSYGWQMRQIATWNDTQMKNMTRETLQRWVNSFHQGPKTIRNLVGQLKTIWIKGQEWEYVSHDPFKGLVLPKPLDEEVAYCYTPAESAAIVAAAPDYYKLMFWVLKEAGTRPSELAGLRAADCIRERNDDGSYQGWIYVRFTVYKENIRKKPKTKESKRWIPISNELCDAIWEHVRETGPNEYGLLFLGKFGGRLNIHHLRKNVLNPILKELGIWDRMRREGLRGGNYAFRHGAITKKFKDTKRIESASELGGHTKGSTTAGYIHIIPRKEDRESATAEPANLDVKRTSKAG